MAVDAIGVAADVCETAPSRRKRDFGARTPVPFTAMVDSVGRAALVADGALQRDRRLRHSKVRRSENVAIVLFAARTIAGPALARHIAEAGACRDCSALVFCRRRHLDVIGDTVRWVDVIGRQQVDADDLAYVGLVTAGQVDFGLRAVTEG